MIQSMTAYARGMAEGEWGSLVLELRSVNHRYLDISLRLPESLRDLESDVREQIRDNLSRGKVECNVNLTQPGGQNNLNYNEAYLQSLLQTVSKINTQVENPAPVNVLNALAWPGVLQDNRIDQDQIKKQLIQLFKPVLADFVAMRKREGGAISEMIQKRLIKLEQEIQAISKRYPIHLKAQQEKIKDRLREISNEILLAPGRLEQEFVLLASKTDVAEEIDRLHAHIEEAKRLLTESSSEGRRFNFLAQEMNREANTLGSKSQDKEISQRSIEMKVLIEQIREQVQNIE